MAPKYWFSDVKKSLLNDGCFESLARFSPQNAQLVDRLRNCLVDFRRRCCERDISDRIPCRKRKKDSLWGKTIEGDVC